MIKKFKFSIYTLEIAFILSLSLIPLLWYRGGKMGLGHDMGFPLDPVGHFIDRLYTWTDRLGPFGSNAVQVLPGVFMHGFEALLSSIGFPLIAVQKITYMFWFVLPGISMYILLRYLHPKKEDYPIRVSGSLFYTMNHYLLQAWTIAERTKFSIIAALPLVVLLIIKVLHQKESPVKNSMLLALTLFFLNGGEGIPLLISLFVVVITTATIFFFLSNESFWPRMKRLFVFSLLSTVFWTLLSSYWLYPYFKSYNQTFGQRLEKAWGTAGAISWSQGISANTSWINLLKLRGIPDWYTNPGHPYANEFLKNPLLLSINFVIVALALIGLINLKSLSGLLYKTRIYFLGLLLVGVPLSAGSHAPLGIVYDYLLANMPGFAMFRSGFFKFGMIIWFAYAYLVAVGVKDTTDWLRTKIPPLILLTVFAVFLFIYNYPFLTGNFFDYSEGKSTMIKVPGYIFEAKKELDSNKFSTRTLSLPNADLRTEYMEYDWGYFSLNELLNIMGRKASIINGVLARPNEVDLIVGILSEYIKFGNFDLIKFTGADKVIIQNDFISPDYEGNPLSRITKSFKKSTDFNFDKSIGKWDFYNYTKESLPQIYSPSKVVSISSLRKDLYLAANLPRTFNEDAFLWSDSSEESSKEEIFNRFLIQAKCADCPPAENYQIFFSTSKVMIPGTPFYQFDKFITDARKYIAGSPNARLDINLSTSTTLISDLGSIQAKRQEKGVRVATNDLIKNLEEIRLNLDQVSDLKTKQKILKKIRFYLSFFISYESQWAAAAQPGSIKSNLSNLEAELRLLLDEIEKGIEQVKVLADDKSYKDHLGISQDGIYDLYIYRQTPINDNLILSVNNRVYEMRRINLNWYKTAKIPLNRLSIIETPKFQGSKERPVIFAMVDSDNKLISPNIEFVALNQTKYLIKVKESGRFVLNFNSRFDDDWSLREVDYKLTSKYFSGDKKSYMDGKVIEYKRGDRHIITDLTFPNNSQKYEPSIELNGFSNGWILDSQGQEGEERTYLLEYNLQNEFYKAVGVSLVSLVIILCLYFYKYGD